MRRAGIRRWIVRGLAVVLAPVLGFLAWSLASDNFGTVRDGQVYRSGQMSAGAIERTVRARGIKTVVNLRGAHPEKAEYRDERAAVLGAGATQVDIAMSSCEWMSRAQAKTLVDVIDTLERPILLHCWHGAERTGLASAFSELLRPGGSLASARAQFSIRYMFLPIKDGAVMSAHLDHYEAWLREQHLEHAPAHFRRWVDDGFRPGRPSREQWPYDPYPLIIITRPAPEAVRMANEASRLRK
jgi:protein tyrosine phosphatase (PTP) superfamily phosphohydrolase (DUF442 family)